MTGRALARTAAAALVGPYLTLASALAPAHIHEPDGDHEHAVAHSHFALHHADDHEHAHDGPDIDHGSHDDHVVWLDGSAVHEAPFQLSAAPSPVALSDETVRIDRHWSVTPFDDGAPVHGPPRPASPFRGPPRSPSGF